MRRTSEELKILSCKVIGKKVNELNPLEEVNYKVIAVELASGKSLYSTIKASSTESALALAKRNPGAMSWIYFI